METKKPAGTALDARNYAEKTRRENLARDWMYLAEQAIDTLSKQFYRQQALLALR